jgi:hypothetical protein
MTDPFPSSDNYFSGTLDEFLVALSATTKWENRRGHKTIEFGRISCLLSKQVEIQYTTWSPTVAAIFEHLVKTRYFKYTILRNVNTGDVPEMNQAIPEFFKSLPRSLSIFQFRYGSAVFGYDGRKIYASSYVPELDHWDGILNPTTIDLTYGRIMMDGCYYDPANSNDSFELQFNMQTRPRIIQKYIRGFYVPEKSNLRAAVRLCPTDGRCGNIAWGPGYVKNLSTIPDGPVFKVLNNPLPRHVHVKLSSFPSVQSLFTHSPIYYGYDGHRFDDLKDGFCIEVGSDRAVVRGQLDQLDRYMEIFSNFPGRLVVFDSFRIQDVDWIHILKECASRYPEWAFRVTYHPLLYYSKELRALNLVDGRVFVDPTTLVNPGSFGRHSGLEKTDLPTPIVRQIIKYFE